MQKDFEEQYHLLEAEHWWFVTRREVLRGLVLAACPKRDCTILEMGCSAGLFMEQLARDGYSQVKGIDISPDAVALCQKAGLDAQMMDAQKLSFPDASFDLITASDVLEHLSDENAALAEWKRVLKPGGLLMVFVPAFMFLWSAHDAANNHHRRYRRQQLLKAMTENGFSIERSSYWNAWLFGPVALVRGAKRLMGSGKSAKNGNIGDLFVPAAPVNAALRTVVQLENQLFRWGINWPVGVSAMAIGRKARAG
jgi:ubiquinone/menaquinone biosynthesis C-methylase UbiE